MQYNMIVPFGQRSDGRATISFFEASAKKVGDELCRWLGGGGYTCEQYRVPDARAAWQQFFQSYHACPDAAILTPTTTRWCAFIDNDKIASMPFGELVSVSERLQCRSVSFMLDDVQNAKSAARPYGVMFYYCDATSGNAVTHSVAVIYDNGDWEYDEQGTALLFEDVATYESRRKADRLTNEMIKKYADFLGIRLNDPDGFYDFGGSIGIRWRLAKPVDTAESLRTIIDSWKKA